MLEINKIYQGNCLEIIKMLPDDFVDCIVTSPPYYALRDYGIKEQIGQEENIESYLNNLIVLFNEIKRVLKAQGTLWVNLGDSYGGTGSKGCHVDPKNIYGRNGQKISKTAKINPKCLLQIPSRFAIKMCDNEWILRSEIIWHKPNAMPSSCKDRFTVDYEKIFFFVKNKKYYFETQYEAMKTKDLSSPRGSKGVLGTLNSGRRKQDLVGRADYTGFNDRYKPNKELKRIKRSVWSISTKPFKQAHFATFPENLINPCILAGCPKNGIILDPFMGAGTTGLVAKKLNRNYIGIELNPDYIKIAEERIKNV